MNRAYEPANVKNENSDRKDEKKMSAEREKRKM